MNEVSSTERCIGLCLSKGVEFAVCLPPGEEIPIIFIPSLPGSGHNGEKVFEIGSWLAPYAERIPVRGETDLRTAIAFLENIPEADTPADTQRHLPSRSTSKESYITEVSRVIDSCRNRSGKTVYSRVICGKTDREEWPRLFSALCEAFPATFRFIFNTRHTGGWIGATPETLLDVNLTDGTFHTMAFAGTRPIADGNIPWDAKNIRENAYVSDYISQKIKELGITVHTGELETVAYGTNIEHLCRHISGSLDAVSEFPLLLDAINPTPALCGSPLASAIDDLKRHEHHCRGCYGGFVALRDNSRFRSFVTLRCCSFSGENFAIYAGGGITPDSIPVNEWEETEAKSLFFRRYLQENT